ncbi:hypothetical protein D9757_012949 [Collybiopsis confluens]|uniref:Uncharacterized protein n=1 Tax=Collybiopsis confluens TaxID=2823264 RepID=A0A8H5D5V6_9AGAR|nr:hypothetical protein D9757_012949 [Collybiopsis confluens]
MARETSEMVLGRDIYERSWKTNSDNSALSVFASGSVNLESRGEQSHPGCSEVPLSTRPQHPCPPTKNRMLISKLTEGGGKKDLSNKADRGTLEQAPRSHSSSPLALPNSHFLRGKCYSLNVASSGAAIFRVFFASPIRIRISDFRGIRTYGSEFGYRSKDDMGITSRGCPTH